ncbi:MAG: hypothetical protein JW822_12500 [Spirochaetales bacterium]|nr:hypothetical protein [Spirochaetales bacterium]
MEPNLTVSQLKNIKQALSIATDEEFTKLLINNKHGATVTAPPDWRELFKTLKPFRFDHSAGITYTENKLKLFWFCGEFGSKGKPDEIISAITTLLTGRGYSVIPAALNEHGVYEHHFTRQQGEFTHLLIVEGVERFVGTPDPRCGGTLHYEITYNKENARPTVQTTLAAFPELNCPELPSVLLEYFNNHTFSTLIYGGTWTRYYNWGVRISHSDSGAAQENFQQVEEIIKNMGFSLIKIDRGVSMYQKQDTHEPIFYVAIYDNTIFSFRIQPHT